MSRYTPARPTSFDITRDLTGFRKRVRTEILAVLQAMAASDPETAAERLLPESGTPDSALAAEEESARRSLARTLALEFQKYFDERERFRLDPEGRSAKHTHFAELDHPASADTWEVCQVLVDHDALDDWQAVFTVDLAASRRVGEPRLRFERIEPIG